MNYLELLCKDIPKASDQANHLEAYYGRHLSVDVTAKMVQPNVMHLECLDERWQLTLLSAAEHLEVLADCVELETTGGKSKVRIQHPSTISADFLVKQIRTEALMNTPIENYVEALNKQLGGYRAALDEFRRG